MAITFLMEGVRPTRVTVGCSPLAELMACLHVLTEREHHPRQQRWAASTTTALSAELAAGLRRFAPLWARYRCRLLLPLTAPLDRPLAEELGTVAALDLDVFAEYVADALVRVDPGDFTEIRHDPEQGKRLVRAARRRSHQYEELAERLIADAGAVRAELMEVLAACGAAFFDEYWDRVGGRLAEAAERLARRLRAEPLPMVFASLGPATRFERSPDRVVYDKLQHAVVNLAERQCLIVPSFQSFPHLLIKLDPRWPVVVHTPMPPAEDFTTPSLAEMKARLVVLSDPQRLALCRHLAAEAITTSDLARRTGMADSQVSRHLARLRAVGLINSYRDGRFVFHRLASDVLMRLGGDLLGAIIR